MYVTVFIPTVEVVTVRLSGWCILGVFLLPAFMHQGHKSQNLLSLCDGMHACTDYTSVYTLIQKSFREWNQSPTLCHLNYSGPRTLSNQPTNNAETCCAYFHWNYQKIFQGFSINSHCHFVKSYNGMQLTDSSTFLNMRKVQTWHWINLLSFMVIISCAKLCLFLWCTFVIFLKMWLSVHDESRCMLLLFCCWLVFVVYVVVTFF